MVIREGWKRSSGAWRHGSINPALVTDRLNDPFIDLIHRVSTASSDMVGQPVSVRTVPTDKASLSAVRSSGAGGSGKPTGVIVTLLMGAFLGGFLAALVMPFMAFACVMLATLVVGSTLVGVRYGASFQIVKSAFVLLFFGQLGYGISLLTRGLVGHISRRRDSGSDQSGNTRPLRFKKRDRAT